MKRIVCLLLAMLLVLPLTVACGNDEKPPVLSGDGTDPADTSAPDTDADSDDTTAAPDTTPGRAHKVPVDELDFDNEEFRTVAFEWQGYPYYFHSDEESSDPMEAALYSRRLEIEDELGVKMTYFMYDGYANLNADIEAEVLMGSTEIDLALLHCIVGLNKFTGQGYLYPMDLLPYVDLEADWWNIEQMEVLRLSDYHYLGVSDYMIPCPYVLYFNKDLVEDLGLDDPYQLVKDQKWTLDAFETMARAATKDVNTDGVYDVENDMFGLAVNDTSNYVSFVTAFNQNFTKRDEDDHLVLALNTETTADVFARFAELTKDNVFYPDPAEQPEQITMDSGRLLFYGAPISASEDLRDVDVPYGILPFPKYDEEQEDYRTLDWGGLMAVPSVVSDEALVGAVLELLAFKASEEVIPAYYDLVLDGQLAQDPETSDMLDIIFDTICYDAGMNYWGLYSPCMQLVFALPNQAIRKQNGIFSSVYAQYGDATQKQIDDYYTTIKLYEDYNEALN